MTDPRINKWYLQREVINGASKHIHEFWDKYLHAGCELIQESDKDPLTELVRETERLKLYDNQ